MTKNEKRDRFCSGCENNFYNGNNSLGVKECWSLKGSKVVQRVPVGIHWMPPHSKSPVTTLDCHCAKGFVMYDPKNSRVRWRGEECPK